jgi:hypothetical protein
MVSKTKISNESKTNMKTVDRVKITSGIGSRHGHKTSKAAATRASKQSNEQASDKTSIRPFQVASAARQARLERSG